MNCISLSNRYLIFRIVVLFVLMFFTLAVSAQNVGINIDGTMPDSSAILDVQSEDKGILIPRVELVAANDTLPVTAPKVSLLVYNTVTSGAGVNEVTPGFYFWNGSIWERLTNGGDNLDWKLEGNSGTNPNNDFLGTSDNVDLTIRTNNLDRIRVKNSGNIGAGLNNPSAKLHVSSLNQNLAQPGVDAGGLLWLGGKNNIDDDQFINFRNPSISDGGVSGMSWWSPDIIFGRYRNETFWSFKETHGAPFGDDVKDIFRAHINDAAGFQNLDKIVVAPDAGNVGIGTDDPSQKLDINGQVRIRGGAPAAGKILTSSADGTATWEVPAPVSVPGSIDWTSTVWVNNSDHTVGAGEEVVHFYNMSANRNVILGTCNASTNVNRQIVVVNHGSRNASTTAGTARTIRLTTGNTDRFPGLNSWGSSSSGDNNVKIFVCMNVPGVGWRWTWR